MTALTIRRATVQDAAAFARILGDPAVFPNLMQLPYTSEEAWKARLTETLAPGKTDLLIVAERGGEVVASAGLHPVGQHLRRRHVAMLGVSVAREAWHQGVGTALMQALCDSADRWMQLLRIELEVYTDNAPAIALYRKFGFEPEATHRNYALRDGLYVDSLGMARLHPHPPMLANAVASAAPAAAHVAAPKEVRNTTVSWTVRAAEPGDDDAVAALMTQRGVVEGLLQTPWASADQIKKLFANPPKDSCSLVAVAEGRVIANARLVTQTPLRRSHVAWLAIFVAPQWQGRGVGTALMTALLDWADRWAGVLRTELAVLEGNAPAMKLYGKFGFEVEGTQRAAVLRDGAYVDATVMARLHPNPPRLPGRPFADTV